MRILKSELLSCVGGQLTNHGNAGILADMRLCAQRSRQVAEPGLLLDLIQPACSPVTQPQTAERVSQHA
jgi:hypothetical protein